MAEYLRRLADVVIDRIFRELPAVFLVGPRAAGKTTTALRRARTVIRLDDAAQAGAFSADPDSALRGLPEPVLLDEWQVVPQVLGAVKRTVDADPRPGRYLITGSVRAGSRADTWPGTGRLVRIAMYGLTVRELRRRIGGPSLFDRLTQDPPLMGGDGETDLRGYVRLALQGGFPPASLAVSEGVRQRWLRSYVDQVVARDALTLDSARDPRRIRHFIEAYAVNTAGVVADRTLFDAAGINRKTALAYERLLSDLFVIEDVPAWSSNRVQRLTHRPKRYLTDAALLRGIIGATSETVLRDADLLGRVLDTFVCSQLRVEVEVADLGPRMFHVRVEQGRHEVDITAELPDRRVIGFEIKADAAPTIASARHLVWLREQLGERFMRGVVFHTGPRPFELDERILALPISAIWA